MLRRAAANLPWVDAIPQLGLNVYSILQASHGGLGWAEGRGLPQGTGVALLQWRTRAPAWLQRSPVRQQLPPVAAGQPFISSRASP